MKNSHKHCFLEIKYKNNNLIQSYSCWFDILDCPINSDEFDYFLTKKQELIIKMLKQDSKIEFII